MRHIFTNQCWRNWNFCRYAKVATGSAATSVMYFTKVLRGDQSIKFGHSNLIYMPVMPWHICRLWLRKPNTTDLTCPNSQTAGFVRTLCCRWARAPSSSRHPPKKRLHSWLTFVRVFFKGKHTILQLFSLSDISLPRVCFRRRCIFRGTDMTLKLYFLF